MYASKRSLTLSTWAVCVAIALSILVLLTLHIQLYYAVLHTENTTGDIFVKTTTSVAIENQSNSYSKTGYRLKPTTTATASTSISTVYPLPHYGGDLCLLYNKNKEHGQIYRHPNIVHYVKISDKESDTQLQLLDYTSIVSVDRFLKPDKIVIHSNRNVTGRLWELAQKLQTRLVVHHIERQPTIGKWKYKKPLAITHEADLHKLDVALKEGGIVMDFDVIILNGNNLRRQQSTSECVLGIERECTFVNSGFLSCVPNSTFIKQWRESYNDNYRNKWSDYLYNSGEYPANVLRQCSSCYNVYLDPEINMNPDAGAPGGPGPGRDSWIKKDGVDWRSKTVVHILLHHLNVPKTNYLLNLWDCSYKELVMHILGDGYKQFSPKTL